MKWILLLLLLGGCASMGAPFPEITTGEVAGDVLTETESVVNNGFELWEVVILGWLIPAPWDMFKGTGGWLLKLFGR